MKVSVRVSHKYVQISPVTSTFEGKDFEVEPYALIRSPVSLNKNIGRYTYRAWFVGNAEMVDCLNNSLDGKAVCENINRIVNKSFKPPKEGWDRDLLILNKEQYEQFKDSTFRR